MVLELAKNDFRAKYAGTVLGKVWAFLCPLITVLIYWFVFQVAFRSGDKYDMPYVLWLVSGVVPWFFIQEAWSGTTNVFVDYSYLVKKVVFRVEILPMVRIVSALFVHIFFVLLLLIVNFACGNIPKPLDLQVVYYMVAAIALVYAFGRITAVINVFFRDMGNVVGVLIQFGFWLTPIFWDVRELSNSTLAFILKVNPVYYVTEGYRETFVHNMGFWESPWLTAYFWGVVFVLTLVGKLLFKRLRPHFADVM